MTEATDERPRPKAKSQRRQIALRELLRHIDENLDGDLSLATLAPALPAVSPDWAPTARYGGYANEAPANHDHPHGHAPVFGADGRLWEMGCGCAV